MVSVGVEDVEALFHRDTLVLVGRVLIAVYHTEHGVHLRTGRTLECLSVEQVADEYGREDIPRAVE